MNDLRSQLIAFAIVIGGLILLVKFIIWPYTYKKEKELVDKVQENPAWAVGSVVKITQAKGNVYRELEYNNGSGSIFSVEENARIELNDLSKYVVVFNQSDPKLSYVKWDKPLISINSNPKLLRCSLKNTVLNDYGYIVYSELFCVCSVGGREMEFNAFADTSYLDGRDSVWVEYLDDSKWRIYDSIEPMYYGFVNGQEKLVIDWIH